MAVTNQELFDIFLNTPNMSDAQIVSLMETRGISPEQISSTFNIPVGDVISRVAATVPEGMSVTLGDTRIAPQYEVRGSGEDRQVVGIENITVEKTTGDINYQAPVGSEFQNYSPTGEFTGTGVTTSSGDTSFFGGLLEALKDPVVLAALAGGYGAGLFGGAGALGGAATVGTTGLTAAEIASLTATDLAIGAGTYAVPTAVGTAAAGLTAAEIAALTAQDLAIGAGTPSALSGVGGLTTVGAGAGALSGGAATTLGGGASTTLGGAGSSLSGLTGGSSLSGLTAGSSLSGLTAGSSLSGLTAGAGTLLGTNTLLGGAGLGTTLAGLGAGVGGSLLGTAATGLGGLTAAQLASLLSTGLTTGSGLLQQQTSREAALAALQRIDAETAAAKASAAFKPFGVAGSRFGTAEFKRDPTTGSLISAGFTPTPEAKNAQDRFLTLAGAGLTQAEGAQDKFKPLQTGAESLFKLGASYLAEKPETVAENYLKSQLALLKPGRDLELANIETRLRNQGRLGLSVAQGGNLGAASPELQALYNARARQEAELAANAQQFGQQQVNFGAGLLGQGASAMGQYYGGQQQAYLPFTTALGQVQGLEQLAQQPLQMGINLGQIGAQTGFDVGRLGLQGAGQATTLATGPAATNNPYATLLSGLGASPTFGAAGVNALGRLFG